MATLYITEFNAIAGGMGGSSPQIAAQLPIAEQTVAVGGGSLQSSAFNARTRFVRLSTDSICSVAFGTNPTATATKMRLAADNIEYFGVPEGQSYKVAVITNS